MGVIVAAISPYRGSRDEVRRMAEAKGVPFIEVYIQASLDALIARDVKGLYKKALAGEMKMPGFRKGKVPPQIVIQRVGREAVVEQYRAGRFDIDKQGHRRLDTDLDRRTETLGHDAATAEQAQNAKFKCL